MKASKRTIFERLLALATRFGRADTFDRYTDEEPPLRSELFSADQMEQHGKTLAGAHRLAPGRAPDRLLARLAENEARPGRSLRPADGGGHGQPPHHAGRANGCSTTST